MRPDPVHVVPRRPSLTRRVAAAGALSAALGGALAALVGGVTASQLVSSSEDEDLLRQAEDYVEEIDEEIHEEPGDDSPEEREHFAEAHGEHTLSNVLIHEAEDLKYPGVSSAVWRAGAFVAGDASLEPLDAGTCAMQADAVGLRRVCAQPYDGGVVLLAVSAPHEVQRDELFLWSIVIGTLVGALLGGTSSLFAARWAVAPLEALRHRVRAVQPDAPSADDLAGPEQHEEIEELRAAIAELVTRLAASLTHAQAFASQAAHELRTPLAMIAGELDLLDEASPGQPEVARMHRQVDGLVALVQRLLALASPVAGEEGIAVDLSDVVDHVVARLPPERRARVRATVDEDVLVRGDESLLAAMVGNALDNALKFSTGDVSLRVTAGGDEASIDVVDDGPGIPPAEREQVFAPFYRTATARAGGPPGHGIGLALIAHVARRHGGTVGLLDAPRGTHLRVTLPRWSTGS